MKNILNEYKMSSEIERLSNDLRDLLSQEMKALQDGMMSIIPAYISGNWGEIETTAGKIRNSYILDQKLTENQMKELHSVLPPEFPACHHRPNQSIEQAI